MHVSQVNESVHLNSHRKFDTINRPTDQLPAYDRPTNCLRTRLPIAGRRAGGLDGQVA